MANLAIPGYAKGTPASCREPLEARVCDRVAALRLRATGACHPEGGRLLHGLKGFGFVTVTGTVGHDAHLLGVGAGPVRIDRREYTHLAPACV